ncbi:N-acetylmuramoyl-L-alanine amidase [Luteibacter rhizovicinus DSM 16549]|uniref:N-acetylmuramoyl-L-alanine amidase AmiC n=1 Tax=Luteibacter rhizovicinus DSM 16549 TaxID=1440763 RepID=A0A0G9HEF6_9GAMM|nr:N-acetylmuramoyl-L-alanine amidase [Luteibacter rhizovicinus DSM 16549]KLD67574.1 cell wall hydrolase [Luteibacter rhizovicinus DSM 16549]
MRGMTIKLGLLACVTAIATLTAVAVSAADVKAARAWAGPEYTRVVFDLSGPAAYKMSQGDVPGSVVLDIAGSSVTGDFSAPGGQGLFKSMSVSKQGGSARLVATVDPRAKPKSFLLKPAGDYGYRLVLDLYPGGQSDPGDNPPPAADHDSPSVASAGNDDDAEASAPAQAPLPTRGSRNSRSKSVPAGKPPMLPTGDRKVVVAIDAGHGGEDPGAKGATGLREKDVTLQVARELADQINRQPGMQAVLTRNGDYFIPLKRRYEIAREHNADMFVSIHADAFKNGDAKGSSVWVLSPRGKTSEASRWLADRENRADLVGGVSLDDKDDSLAAVLLDLQQGYAMQASESIAGNVLKALGRLGPTHRGYVERANFVVLRSPDVPSILVETAFITNPAEETRLRDDGHRRELATAVLGGVRNYFESMPPPGTWFAAQAARRNGGSLASTAASAPAAPAVAADAGAVASDAVKAATRATPPRKTLARADTTASVAKASNGRADDNVRDLHRVNRGETLTGIANQYGVSVGALKMANKMNDDNVRIGSVMVIPSG